MRIVRKIEYVEYDNHLVWFKMRIKKIRLKHLAERMGCSIANISHIINQNVVRRDIIERLCTILMDLGLSKDDIKEILFENKEKVEEIKPSPIPSQKYSHLSNKARGKLCTEYISEMDIDPIVLEDSIELEKLVDKLSIKFDIKSRQVVRNKIRNKFK